MDNAFLITYSLPRRILLHEQRSLLPSTLDLNSGWNPKTVNILRSCLISHHFLHIKAHLQITPAQLDRSFKQNKQGQYQPTVFTKTDETTTQHRLTLSGGESCTILIFHFFGVTAEKAYAAVFPEATLQQLRIHNHQRRILQTRWTAMQRQPPYHHHLANSQPGGFPREDEQDRKEEKNTCTKDQI